MAPLPHWSLLWWSRIVSAPFIGVGLVCSFIVAHALYEQDPLMHWLEGLDQPPKE